MTRTRIYFFSGAGHSFAVARDLAASLEGAEPVNIASLLKAGEVRDDSDLIGFVFPVYGSSAPKFIREWLTLFRPGQDSICFAVCTCGIAPGHSLIEVDRILKASGSGLTWGFSIKQPQSGIGSRKMNTPEFVEECMSLQKRKIPEIAEAIRTGRPSAIEKSSRFSEFFNSSTLKAVPTIFKLIGHLITRGMKNMKFHPGEGCVSCGTCVRLCPTGNVRMIQGRPAWGDYCTGCMACYHWCPEDAVKNVDLDMVQSPHPEVTLEEMLVCSETVPVNLPED